MNTTSRQKILEQSYDALVTEISQFERSFHSFKSLKRGKTLQTPSPYIDIQPPFHRRSLKRPQLSETSQEVVLQHRLPVLVTSRLGPGYYQPEASRSPAQTSFDTAPRFPASFQERIAAYHPHVRELSFDERRHISHRIQSNIQAVKRFTPDQKRQSLQKKAELEQTRLSLTRSFHLELTNNLRKQREENLENKLRRFEWRMNPEMVWKGKKRWVGVICALNSCNLLKNRFAKRKILHEKSQKILKFLLLVSMTIGKIRVTLKENRRKKAFCALKRLIPFISRWRISHRRRLIERIDLIIESCISQHAIYKLIVIWKSRVSDI